MITKEEIARINELYHKMKEQGLTAQEKQEQMQLREKYIKAVRANLRGQLDAIDIQNPDGSIERLKDRKKKKKYLSSFFCY